MNLPQRSDRTRRTRWWRAGLMAAAMLGLGSSQAQVNYSFNFDAGQAGWTASNFFSFTGATACGGAGGATRANLYSGVTSANIVSPLTGVSQGGLTTVSYTYKAANWSANTVGAPTPWGSFQVQYGATATGPWTTIATISDEAQTGNCLPKSHTFTPPAGNLFLRWIGTWTGGDYYLNFDNVVVSETASPCAGIPSPGNTVGPTQACTGANFNLSLQNATPGSGVSYAWQSADDAGFTTNVANLGTSSTLTTSITSNKYFRCNVTCAGNGTTASTPLFVEVTSAPALCGAYCDPVYTFGKTDGDLISNVVITGTTLSNNTGTAPVNPAYTFFTGAPNLTADLQAGGTYNVQVTIGSFTNQGVAVWIDYNDNGVFETPAERVGFTSSQINTAFGTGSFPIVLDCDPPLGLHRMRVRDVWNTTGVNIDPCLTYGYGETEDYVVNITTADPCPTPFNLTALATSSSSADLTWTLGCAETLWDVHIQPVGGGAPGTPSNPGVTSSTFSATGLTAGVLYEYYVRADCGGNGTSTWAGPVTFSAQSDNDICANITPVALAAGATVNATGNTFGATANDGLAVGPTQIAAVWHAVTLSECIQSFTVSMCGTTPVLPFFWGPLYSDCGVTQIGGTATTNTTACTDGNLTIAYGQLQAGTYYFPVFAAAGFNPPADYDIAFTAGAACPPPPANDLCANAIAVTCGTTYTGNTVWATNTGAPVFGGTCGTTDATANGVWYTVSGVCGTTTASMCGSSYDSKIFVMTGSCGAFTCVVGEDDDFANCGDADPQVDWVADAGTTYYIYVTGFGTAAGDYSLVVNCSGTPVVATANLVDDCLAGTYTIDVDITDLGGAGSADITYAVNGGSPVTVPGVSTGVTALGPFQTLDEVTVDVSNGSLGCGVDLGAFSSNCPIELVCGNTTTVNYCYKNNDSKTWTFNSPTPGETVTLTFVSGTIDEVGDVVRIYDGVDNTGTLLVSSTVNSLVGLTATSSGQSIYMEVDSDPSNSCQDGNQTSWTFEVECTPGCVDPDGSVTVTTDCGTYSFSIDVEVLFTGDGGSTDLSYSVNGGTPTIVPGLLDFDIANIGPFTVGDDVQLFLLHPVDPACNKNLGTFTDNGTCPPLGTDCLSARPVNSYPYTHSATTCGFGNQLGIQCSGNYGGGEDYVYRLNITSTGIYTINLSATGGGSWIGWFLKDGANCTVGSSCLANAVSGGGTVANGQFNFTTPGTYFLIIDTWPAPNCSAYTLNINFLAPCTGTPAPGNTISSVSTVCPATNFNLSLQNTFTDPGITYQWFRSTVSATGPWTLIPAATAATLTTTQSAASWYYCAVTCSTGPSTGDSNPVQVALNTDPIACLCTPTYTFGKTDGDLISNVVIVGTTLSNNTGTAPVNPAYTYFNTLPNHTGTLVAGTSYPIQVTVGTFSGQNVAVWIDFNENGVFETPSERVGFTTTSIGSNGTGTFTLSLPCNPTPGLKRMRVRDVWNTPGNTIDPCANYGYGETEDYDVTVAPPPPCPTPSGLVVSGITGSSANLNWTAGCTETAWIVQYGPVGFTLGSGTSVSAAATNASLSGLTGSTSYDVYVQADCDANGLSTWLGPVTFATAPINDDCANAIAIGCNSVTTGTTVSSTTTDAPALCGTTLNTAGGVWYTLQGWDGPMTAELCGTGFDSKIGVFTGTCGALTCLIGEDDDFTECGTNAPSVTWVGTSGTTYYIYVTGFSTNTGAFTLTTSCGSNNSACPANGLTLEFQTDAAPFQTTWEIRNSTGVVVATSGGPLVAPFGVQTESGCVPDGCYTLRVLDAGGDGMTTGGYILRTQGTNQRIIDNRNNFNTGFVSAISGGQGFCLPISNQGVLFTSCDKLDWINGQYVVAAPNPAVSAEWIVGGANNVQDANSGYEFWIFDPNGSYSFRRFRSHNVSDGFGPASATRACHMKLNNWTVASQVPANVLMNVRVRTRVNGVNGEFGPACRLMIDPVRAACPLTNLMDIPGNQFFSCGVFRNWGNNNYVHARPVSGANRYQFRFRLPAEGYEVIRQNTTYFVQLNWSAAQGAPLENGKTYDVDVRVSKDGGLTWCSTSDPWGNVCQVTIGNPPASAMADMIGNGAAAELRMFPNPNRGDQVTFNLSAIEEGVNTVTFDVYDLSGKRVITRQIAVAGGNVNTNVDLNGELAAGMYTVNIIAGNKTYNERLMIQP